VPLRIDGRAAEISGTFTRVARPAGWPWVGAAALLVALVLLAARLRSARARLTLGLGVGSGVASLALVTTFAVRDAPTGGVAWLQLAASVAVAAVLAGLLLRLRGRAQVHAAGVVGAVAAAVSISSLSIFWHGVVISVLPGAGARALCTVAIVGGAAAAVLSFLPDFDEPVRARRPVARPLPR